MAKRIDTSKLRRRYYDNDKDAFYECSQYIPIVQQNNEEESASYIMDFASKEAYDYVCELIEKLYGDSTSRPTLNGKTIVNEFCCIYEKVGEKYPLYLQLVAFCDCFAIEPKKLIEVLPSAMKSMFVEEMSDFVSKEKLEKELYDNDYSGEGLF